MDTTTARPIRRPPRRPKGSAGQYSRTTITLDLPTMRRVIADARRKNLTISGYIEQIVAAHLGTGDTTSA
jgi:hypothetical protein